MYQLDTNAAREADSFGNYLSETGKYVGKFIRAERLVSKKKGTHGVGFTFESHGKQTTRFDIWTKDAQGKNLSGFNAINALMACMSLRGLQVASGDVERYNWETQQRETVQAEVFPALTGPEIGLVLQKTEYEKMREGVKTGETGWRLELVAPFRATDEFTASEILDRKTKPEKLTSVIATLSDRPLKNRQATRQQDDGYGQPPAGHPAGNSGFSPDDSDIPF